LDGRAVNTDDLKRELDIRFDGRDGPSTPWFWLVNGVAVTPRLDGQGRIIEDAPSPGAIKLTYVSVSYGMEGQGPGVASGICAQALEWVLKGMPEGQLFWRAYPIVATVNMNEQEPGVPIRNATVVRMRLVFTQKGIGQVREPQQAPPVPEQYKNHGQAVSALMRTYPETRRDPPERPKGPPATPPGLEDVPGKPRP
jgi:hypothetical protein